MEEYINVKISIDNAMRMFRERLEFWKLEEDDLDLFLSMYESYLDAGVFSGIEFDIRDIVDNDYVNYTTIVREDNEDFNEVLELYKEGGLTDISCESKSYSYIEAVDNEDNPKAFLVRYL